MADRVRSWTHGFSDLATNQTGSSGLGILGSLLFALYINDLISQALQSHPICRWFANLLALSFCQSWRSLDSYQRRYFCSYNGLQFCYSFVIMFCDYLTLNPGKTKAILLDTAHFINNIQARGNIELFVNNTPIELSSQIVNLGITITSTELSRSLKQSECYPVSV